MRRVLTPSRGKRSGDALAHLIRAQRVTHATLPPVLLPDLPDDVPLQTLVVAGESCAPDLVARWSRGRRMINAYGPTETTVCATMSEALAGAIVPPIGRPIWNTQVYVLDGGLEPVPAGVSGELYIAGSGRGRAAELRRARCALEPAGASSARAAGRARGCGCTVHRALAGEVHFCTRWIVSLIN